MCKKTGVLVCISDDGEESIIYEDIDDDDQYDEGLHGEDSLKHHLFRRRADDADNDSDNMKPYPVRANPFPGAKHSQSIHLLLTLDQKMLVGLPTLITSVLRNTKSHVRFHIMWCQDNVAMVKQYLSCFDIPGFSVDDLDIAENVGRYMNAMFWKYLELTGKIHKKLESCADLVRLQSHRIFPYLDKVLWLDVDMIAQGQ